MKAKPVYDSGYLIVYPRAAGDFGWASMPRIEYKDDSHLREMKDAIERHVDNVHRVYIDYETWQCSVCGCQYDTQREAEHCCTTTESN